MHPPRKPWWQQATALVSLGTGGAITGFAFAHGTPEHLASPASVPVTLTALDQAAQPATTQAASDESVVRSAIVKVASYYAKLAQTKTPAQMEALIWQHDSQDGGDHGQSCAAFASMTLQLGAQLAGKQSWVSGGSTYPWPLHDWVDARVDPNSDSLNITSILQDAQSHQRWHPLGDGYQPEAGDWVLFDEHVEVVTAYSDGVLSTIGGDSLPNFSVNAHEYSGSLSANGVQGFVDNGDLPATTTAAVSSGPAASVATAAKPSSSAQQATPQDEQQPAEAMAAIPGTATVTAVTSTRASGSASAAGSPAAGAAQSAASAAIPGMPATPAAASITSPATGAQPTAASVATQGAAEPSAAIPGVPAAASATASSSGAKAAGSASSSSAYQRHQSTATTSSAANPGSVAQRAFISQIAPGALAAQRSYGVPAAVTIAQAIDESAWGQSTLASQDHNLFGIKGTGPAGSVSLPTQEVYNGQAVSITAQFRVYNDVAESIEDHGKLLASSGSYTAAMANQQSPNAFANALTGVYATDPTYGSSLISLMRQYNLYRYDASASSASSASGSAAAAKTSPKAQPHGTTQSHPASRTPTTTQPSAKATAPSLTTPTTSPAVSASSPVATAPASTGSTTSPSSAATPAPVASGSGSPSASASSGSAAPAPAPRPHPFATPTSSGRSSGASGGGSTGSTVGTTSGQADIPGVPVPASSASGSQAGRSGSSTGGRGGGSAGSGSGAAASSSGGAGSSSGGSGSSTGDGGSSAQPSAQASTSARVSSSAPVTDATLTAVIEPAGQATPAGQAAPTSHATQNEKAAAARAPARKAPKRKGPTAKARRAAPRYVPEMPTPVKSAVLSSARKPLGRAEFLYRDVAASVGLPWKILAACDWMQCDAHPRYSPVQGEKLGTVNPDGTVFHTKSEALTQTARDLVTLADAVYEIDLTVPVALTVLELANVFAAYRWGGLLRQHQTSAMEFPYSVQGLTDQFLHMRWPKIANPNAPDKPGARYKRAFGAVPVVLSLDYPAIVL